jgi:tRNA G18 (ribose-2'-O)-methylase SpoU
VSVGHVLHVPFARLVPWPDGLGRVRAAGFVVAALVPGPPATTSPHVALSGMGGRLRAGSAGVALLLGAEGPGLSDAAVSAADLVVSIPLADGVDSLNVAAAAAVAFFAVSGL